MIEDLQLLFSVGYRVSNTAQKPRQLVRFKISG
jgi:hypothetical protein